jgi:hypothetical protein
MMPPEKDNAAINSFLEREKEDLQAIEKRAMDAKKSALTSGSANTPRNEAPIDWDKLEQYLLTPGVIKLDLEAAQESSEYSFLVENYEKEPDSDIMRTAIAAAKQKKDESRAKNKAKLKEAEERAAKFIATIEAEEQADYKEQQRRLER